MNKVVLGEVRRIIEQTRRRKPEITCLEVSTIKIGKFSPELKKLIEQLYNLEILSLADCSLTSLDNLPNLQQLQHIDLTGNKIPDDQIKYLKRFKKLKILNLGFNQLSNFDVLLQLKQLQELEQLELYENPLAEEPEYKNKVFQSITTLKILDGEDKFGRLIEEEDDYDQDVILEEADQQSDQEWENQKRENVNDQFDQLQGENAFGMEEQEEEMPKTKKGGKKGSKKGSKKGGKSPGRPKTLTVV